jgi:hypothetical protein
MRGLLAEIRENMALRPWDWEPGARRRSIFRSSAICGPHPKLQSGTSQMRFSTALERLTRSPLNRTAWSGSRRKPRHVELDDLVG